MSTTEFKFECGVCKSHKAGEQVVAKEMCKGTRNRFNYTMCADCGTLQLTDPPENLAYYYDGYYSLNTSGHGVTPLRKMIWKMVLLTFPELGDKVLERYGRSYLEMRSLRRLPRKADWKILDVGSGNGDFINFLAEIGFTNCLGCDPFIEKDIHHKSGANIVKKSIHEIDGKFDLVMLHHAYEHVPEPQRVMDSIAARMERSGYCIIRIPNIDSIEYRRYKGDWWGIHAPYHTFLYSRSAINMLAEKSSMNVVHTYCDSREDHYLYSEEYSLDINDKSPLSARQGGGLHIASKMRLLREKAAWFDRLGIGDWIVYILRHKDAA